MLADLLNSLAAQKLSPHDVPRRNALTDALEEARAVVAVAADDAASAGDWSPEEPLRLTKDRIRGLLQCPRRALAAGSSAPGNMDDLLLGVVVDSAAKLLALGAARPVTVEATVAFLDAQDDHRVSQHLADIGEAAASDLLEEATIRLDHLNGLWPEVAPQWWPRVEEPVRVPLADRSVMLSGRLDIVLGGPPTDTAGVIVEIKGGRWHDSARSETYFYSLLLGLRDGAAPSHVVSLAAADGATHVEEVRPAIVGSVARQVVMALETAASIAAGEVPEARPGRQCATCPVAGDCPAATAVELTGDRAAA